MAKKKQDYEHIYDLIKKNLKDLSPDLLEKYFDIFKYSAHTYISRIFLKADPNTMMMKEKLIVDDIKRKQETIEKWIIAAKVHDG